MNIIAGKYKGRKLASVDSLSTRPTLARIKESVFCMLDGKIEDKNVLDLFAGSGALGIECISRGANKVWFCDASCEAVKILKKNLINIKEDYVILCEDYIKSLDLCSGVKFDLVFLDPPYATDLGEKAIEILIKKNMLNDDALIVFEHSSKKSLQNLNCGCIIIKSKKYGTKTVDIVSYKR